MRGVCPICCKKKELLCEVLIPQSGSLVPLSICRGCWHKDMKPRILKPQVGYVEA